MQLGFQLILIYIYYFNIKAHIRYNTLIFINIWVFNLGQEVI